ncbi:MAG TPA: right-handed parallel beta-helix repeat-containing protein [Puia sp.]|jgi:hypothetical protein|nr:right-handed parallel beta-helix repeat-containing protein [Puia sp.]
MNYLFVCICFLFSGHNYYLSSSGDDNGDGTKDHPWTTIGRLKAVRLMAGDTVFFRGGEIFEGSLEWKEGPSGTKTHPLVITSYEQGKAVIKAGDGLAIGLYQAKYVEIRNLQLVGSGRKNGNTQNGLVLNACQHIDVDSVEVKGFIKAGVYVYRSDQVTINRVDARENGYAGISVEGAYGKRDCHAVRITDCRAANNPGDPSDLSNHSGNGIVAGYCRKVVIDHCTATNNGWDMPRIGNGPVGIWAYESDSVLIQHCISYRNKTSKGGDDGGGYDLDGGMTHSTIRYCLSYENEGSGFGLFQYAGASPWFDNSIHDCVSQNDGLVSAARAGVFIWNSSRDTGQLRNCRFYNNIIYNTKGAAIHYAVEGEHSGFRFYNNAFIATDSLIKGHRAVTDVFENNHWTGILPDSSFH